MAERDPELQARFERLRALNAAWAELAPFGLSEQGQRIVEPGRAVSAELEKLAGEQASARDEAALMKIDALLGAIEGEMRALAFEVPVGQLRSTLPARVASEGHGVLDLLDLMLAAEMEGEGGSAGRLGAIDYLITLLCTGAGPDGRDVRDPVGLTPRLAALCERAGKDEDRQLTAIAAEFYAAADMTEADAHEEVRQRALRRRKRELGAGYFAPRVLRAVVAYNAALAACIEREVGELRDWTPPAGETAPQGGTDASVFQTDSLPRLAEALRRRAAGSGASSSAVDRVAWCLDLDSVTGPRRAALLSPAVGRPEGVEGTTVLVGLLLRAAAVLEGEFPAIGIPPDTLAEQWVRELDAAIKREVNQRIASDRYDDACALSELRVACLHATGDEAPGVPPVRKPRPSAPVKYDRRAPGARQPAAEDTKTEKAPPPGRGQERERKAARSWSLPRLGLRGGALLGGVVLLAAVLVQLFFFSGEVTRMSAAQLARVSPFLEGGGRNGDGQGTAFVGRLGDEWARLDPAAQQLAAADLVEALRAQGVREVMIYDDAGHLRIQALGPQPPRVVAEPASGG